MSDKTASSSGGIGFTGALTVLFVGLKLTHVVDWSWWWVVSPLWIAFACFSALTSVLATILVVRESRRKR